MTDICDPETGEITKIKYREGQPLVLRFDASRGILNKNGETNLSKPGEPFSFIPISLRVFRDTLFDQAEKEWAEFCTVTKGGIVCSLLFHGYSVKELLGIEADLFYFDLEINKIILTAKPLQKTTTKNQENGRALTYYICEFSYTPAPKDLIKYLTEETKNMKLYRADTMKPGQKNAIEWNYGGTIPPLPEPEPALPEPEKVSS